MTKYDYEEQCVFVQKPSDHASNPVTWVHILLLSAQAPKEKLKFCQKLLFFGVQSIGLLLKVILFMSRHHFLPSVK